MRGAKQCLPSWVIKLHHMLSVAQRDKFPLQFRVVTRLDGKALSELGICAEPALLQALHHPDNHVRWHAARLLGQIGDPRAVDVLVTGLWDEDQQVRWATARVLANLDMPAVPAMSARARTVMPTAAWWAWASTRTVSSPVATPTKTRGLCNNSC